VPFSSVKYFKFNNVYFLGIGDYEERNYREFYHIYICVLVTFTTTNLSF